METLIHGLIERTNLLLPFNRRPGIGGGPGTSGVGVSSASGGGASGGKMGDLRINASSLIKLSRNRLDAVIEGLLHMYSTLTKSYNNLRASSEFNLKSLEEKDVSHEKFIRSKIIIFQLFSKTLSAAIGNDKLDLRFDDDFLSFNDELYNRQDEMEREQQQQQQQQESNGDSLSMSNNSINSTSSSDELPVFDESNLPQLEVSLAQTLLKYIIETLYPNTNVKAQKGATAIVIPPTLKHLCARVLFKLSVVNFDVVFSRIESFFKNMKNDEVDVAVYGMIEFINFDSWKLSRLVSLFNDSQVSHKFKKSAFQAIAHPMHQAIWNWISNYPHQFIKFCRNKSSLPGNPMLLFENISAYAGKNDKRKSQVWPLLNMLLLLCPEIMSTVIMSVKQGTKIEARKKQRKFLESLLKALRSKDKLLSDVALVCFVDLYKASTFLSKSDLSALRFLVSDVQNDLQERLMNVDNPVKDQDGKIDVQLMVDFFVSAYCINQRHVTSYIFPLCFKGPAVFKLVMTKAMFKLAQQGAALPWHPTLAESYAFLAKPLRTMFQELLQEERQKRVPSTKGPVVEPYNTETLLTLLAVFYCDPRLVLENTSNSPSPTMHINDILYLFGGLCNCLGDFSNMQIQNQAYRLLQKMFGVQYMELWCQADVAAGFVELSSSVLTHLATSLIADKDLQGQNSKTLLDLMKEITSSSNEFIAKNYDKITPEHLKSRKRVQSLDNLETALLVLLCSPEPEIWATAASCLGDLTEQMRMLREKENKQGSLYMNFNLYMQLSKVDDLGRGRSQQHKVIRKLLRRVDLQTKANLAAFIEIYSRWKTYTQTLLSSASTGRDDVKEAQFTKLKPIWKNLTAFLCSMGGVCLQAGEGVFASGKKQKDSAVTDDVIKDLMRLVVSDIQFVRDTVTQTIGTDLSPTLYGILFTNLHSKVASFFGEEGSVHVSETSTQFVDQAIYIVKSIIEQAQENADDLTLADFETLILSFVKYCSQLVLSHESVRIKCKLCILIETMINRKEFITFINELQFRFTCLRSIIEWTSDFALKSQGAAATAATDMARISALFRDLDVLCMRAIASVLKDLQLAMIKGDKHTKGKDREEANKREFLKYFSFLSKYLSKSKADKDSHPQLRDFTVISLGNLLESNINYGLEHFMKMAYIEDQETRAAFLVVLTTIMRQGINLSDGDSTENQHQKYDRLLQLLTGENLDVLFALLSVVPMSQQDQLCNALVALFDQQNQVLRLLKTAIDREVETTNSPGTLFRANSTASKMVVAYFKLLGKEYLQQTVGSMIKELCLNPFSCEVDPTKKKSNEDLEQNIQNLERTAQLFLDCIAMSVNDLPRNLRIVCKHLSDRVNAKFPLPEKDEDGEEEGHAPKYVAIGGVLFLRFINPSIVTPHVNGITEARPSASATRCLMLITKIMQNLSNGTYFVKKEPYMAPFDRFIDKNKSVVRSFFDQIIDIDDGSAVDDSEQQDQTATQEEARDDYLITLHRFLFENQEKLIQKMQQNMQDSGVLVNTLNDLGKPPEEEKSFNASFAGGKEFTSGLFTEFVTRMEMEKDLKDRVQKIEEKQLFYKRGESVNGRPVLYFIGRKFGEIDGDIDVAYYHVLVTLRSVFANPFEVVFDCTDLREEHELKPALFAKLHKMLPHGARKNLARVIVYNPNLVLKSVSKPFSKFISRRNAKKIVFASGLRDIYKLIDAKNLALPESTVEFEHNVESTISPAWIVNANGTQTECTIRLSNKKLCISAKKDTLFGLDAKRVEFIDIATINNIKIEKHPNMRDIDCVTVNFDWPNKIIHLKTDINEQLLMSIKASITRHVSEYRLVASMQQETSSEGMRQSDIPGVVLNMCFLNLESKFPKTRNAAYNLLAALAEQFDFPVTLLETQNMCVPHNTGDLVVAISEQVARAKPFLTTQFLRESLRGFTKISYQNKVPYKYMCLAYMKPWVQNLSVVYAEAEKNDDTEQITRIKEWFSELTKTTVDESDIYPALLNEIWGEISKDLTLVEISIGCIMKEAIDTGLGSKKVDILNDLIVTLASHETSSELVAEIIINSTMRAFEEVRSLQTPLESNAPWAKLLILCRFLLMLSFQNRVQVAKNLPRLLHIVTMMVGRGSPYFRATIHSLTLNIIHSLAIALPFFVDSRKTMQGYLSQMTQEPLLLAFMGSASVDTDPFQTLNVSKERQSKLGVISMWELESLTSFLMEVMRTCFKADPTLESTWHDGWTAIIKTEAEKMNPIHLPRLLCVLGVVVSPRDTQDHLPFVLNCLTTSFENYISLGTISANKFDFSVAVILCLGQLCQKLSPDAKIISRLMLLPIILLSACDATLFSAVVHLLKCVLQSVSNSLSFRDSKSLEDYFNTHCRDSEMEPMVSKFEKLTGISFKTHFSFALASHLMKGLTMPNVNTKGQNVPNPKEQTAQMYTMLINVSNRISTNVQDMFGFITALLPFQMDTIPSLLGDQFHLFSEDNFHNSVSATLFVRMLLTIVQNCEMDNDKVTIYATLQEAFQKLPNVFEPIYPQVMPRVIQVYNMSTSTRIAEVTLALINTMMADNPVQTDKDTLKELNFSGLTRAGSFKTNSDKARNECLQIFHEACKVMMDNSFSAIGMDTSKKLQLRMQDMQYVDNDTTDTRSITSAQSQHSLTGSFHKRHQSTASDITLSLKDGVNGGTADDQSDMGTDTEHID